MSYAINIEINGFQFQFGNMGYDWRGLGSFVNFSNTKIKSAIENDDPLFYESLKELFNQSDELHALYTFEHFEHYELQGNGWKALTDHYSFDTLENYKSLAIIVLNSNKSNQRQLKTAQTLLDVLSGKYKYPPSPEKSPEEKARSSFENKKDKLRLKLVIRDTYRCSDCESNKEGSLCIDQKVKDIYNYDIENLLLRCRKCFNKAKINK